MELRNLRAKGGYGNNNYRGNTVKTDPGKSFVRMTGDQKRAATCADWNGTGCNLPEISGHCGSGPTRKKHGCSPEWTEYAGHVITLSRTTSNHE